MQLDSSSMPQQLSSSLTPKLIHQLNDLPMTCPHHFPSTNHCWSRKVWSWPTLHQGPWTSIQWHSSRQWPGLSLFLDCGGDNSAHIQSPLLLLVPENTEDPVSIFHKSFLSARILWSFSNFLFFPFKPSLHSVSPFTISRFTIHTRLKNNKTSFHC